MSDSSQPLLPELPRTTTGSDDTQYRCPGESSPVSKAIHLGRLAAGWTGCTGCVWEESHSHQKRPGEVDQTALSFQRRRASNREIRRTEFGVRGAYLNAIDRFRGAQLASIFSTHLTHVHSEVARLRHAKENAGGAVKNDDRLTSIGSDSGITIAIGYDGRHGAADVFSGAVSAVRQNGCNVIDAGLCTAASLQNVCRRFPHVSGSLLVTGAGASSGEIGLDAFDPNGQGLAVPWQTYGVSIRLPGSIELTGSETLQRSVLSDSASSPEIQNRLHSLRATAPHDSAAGNTVADVAPVDHNSVKAVLRLPDLQQSADSVFRSSRRSGTLSPVMSEKFFQDWLLRWYPVQSRHQARFHVNSDLAEQRLRWLTEHCSLNIEILRQKRDAVTRNDGRHRADSVISFDIHEDDRFLTVRSRRGRELPVDELAGWVNRCMPSNAAHLTAHPSPCGRHLLLVDVAAPNTGTQQQVISDGLAIAGWILTSISDGENPLPL